MFYYLVDLKWEAIAWTVGSMSLGKNLHFKYKHKNNYKYIFHCCNFVSLVRCCMYVSQLEHTIFSQNETSSNKKSGPAPSKTKLDPGKNNDQLSFMSLDENEDIW